MAGKHARLTTTCFAFIINETIINYNGGITKHLQLEIQKPAVPKKEILTSNLSVLYSIKIRNVLCVSGLPLANTNEGRSQTKPV